ncbi:hypothetical protein B0H14DRAFT_2584770 [Mycena olivaceomarginata]|nr:hypothetical protein B0H14DRAFT_2584770 [Mycena olivaceomarginata]
MYSIREFCPEYTSKTHHSPGTTFQYLQLLQTNGARSGHVGKDGEPNTPREADEWEETPEGSTGDSAEFGGETEGFWKGMGFARNPTFMLVYGAGHLAAATKN